MLLSLIRDLKVKLAAQGVEPKYLYCSSQTKNVIKTTLQNNFYNITKEDNSKAESIDGLEIKEDENIPLGQLYICGDEFDVENAVKKTEIMQSTPDDIPGILN
jgi:hypothetical protein